MVVLAGRHGTTCLLTLDERHFRTVRPLTGRSFTLLPADAAPRLSLAAERRSHRGVQILTPVELLQRLSLAG